MTKLYPCHLLFYDEDHNFVRRAKTVKYLSLREMAEHAQGLAATSKYVRAHYFRIAEERGNGFDDLHFLTDFYPCQ